jgi:hypothetical protein
MAGRGNTVKTAGLDELSSIMNSITNLTPQQLRNAADIQERIIALQQQLEQLLGASPLHTIPRAAKGRRLSAQGLANIRAGARKRWARERAKNGLGERVKKPRGKMSAAGRASISAQLKARWAAAKRAGRKAL